MRFTPEVANEIIRGQNSEFETREIKILSHGRWTITKSGVFMNLNGTFWTVEWTEGATEYQEMQPFEGEEYVEFYQVKPKRVTRVEYVAI